MQDDLHLPSAARAHPVDPLQRVLSVQAAEAHVFSLALSVRPFVHDQHGIAVSQIIIGQAHIVVHAAAGIAVKTDDRLRDLLLSLLCGKPGPVQLQAVKGFLMQEGMASLCFIS